MREVETDLEAEAEVVAEVGHQMGCWEWWAEEAIEAGKIADDHLLAAYINEVTEGFQDGRSCHCLDEATGHYLPDLAEILALAA